jgi:hypothetical protein
MSSSGSALRMDWATYASAKYAIEHWYYTRSMPRGRLVRIGAWEGERFVGVIMFGYGANNHLGRPYGLQSHECVEMVRVAMRDHVAPVTRMLRIAIMMLRKKCPGLRLIVSFADPTAGHGGGIYKGGNWIQGGMTGCADEFVVHGTTLHGRSARMRSSSGVDAQLVTLDWLRKHKDPNATKVKGTSKLRFLMPLDVEIRERITERLRAGSTDSDAVAVQAAEGGATPTPALQKISAR